MGRISKYAFLFLSLLCFFGSSIRSYGMKANADSLTFERYSKVMDAHISLPLNQLVVRTALFFLDRPYLAGTLEQPGPEHLVVNLSELDCTTFVENCVVLSLTMKSADRRFAHYKLLLQGLRYRDGSIAGYPSRLHYSSDWIFENEQKGVWTNITLLLGGTLQDKEINFMSTHAQLYPAMAADSLLCLEIAQCEESLNKRKCYILLSKEKIALQENSIRDGDIVFFGTRLGGLDFSHMAIAYHHDGVLSFIHASSAGKKVMIQPSSLLDYCLKSKNCIGIAVVRLNDVRN